MISIPLLWGLVLSMKQEIKQAGVVLNPGAQARNFEVDQTFNEASQGVDLETLAFGLVALREALQKEPDAPEKSTAITAVTDAEAEAKNGNREKTLEFLAKAGKWSLEVATKIGGEVAAAAIKTAIGIK